MELPHRKTIRLKGYDYSQNNAYFITICTQNRANLFGEIVGATPCGRPLEMIDKWILKIPEKFSDTEIDKYIIMPNHVHIIIILCSQTGDHTGSPLQEIVEWFKTMTTNEYIRGVKNGIYQPFYKKIWQRSYYDEIIKNKEHYENVWNYIEINPQNWEKDEYYIQK